VKKIKCQHCQKSTPLKKLLNGQYCLSCVTYCTNLAINGIKFRLRGARSCVIPGCDNRTDQGDFVGDLCSPCHSYITRNEGTHSQAYRNEILEDRDDEVGGARAHGQEDEET
jgi:hypothetical protein